MYYAFTPTAVLVEVRMWCRTAFAQGIGVRVGESVKNAVDHKKPCSFCARFSPLIDLCPARIIRKVVILAGQKLIGGVRWAPSISGFEDLVVMKFYFQVELNLIFTILFPFYCFVSGKGKTCLLEKLGFVLFFFL